MNSQEIVCRAIEFRDPPRLPFFQHSVLDAPDDVCDIWEMDRSQAGWFFDTGAIDDWNCGWSRTEHKNMGQVTTHPLEDLSRLASYQPPDPHNPFYFQRIEPLLNQANNRYVVVTGHFNLIERLHMLRGFLAAMEGFYRYPQETEIILDMILEFRIRQLDELHRRFGSAIHGIFLTDDWGTQQGLFIGLNLFDQFFAPRYKLLFDRIHQHGWHIILHSCGKINKLVPHLIDLGVDVLNMQQPTTYGIEELGRQFKGRVCFLTTVDIQTTLVHGNPEAVRTEAQQLIEHWSTRQGGFIVFNYGDPDALGISEGITETMFDEFVKHMWL